MTDKPFKRAKDIKDGKVPATLPKAARRSQEGLMTSRSAMVNNAHAPKATRPHPIPWTPRTYSADGIELVCPIFLQSYTDEERDLKHYPDAVAGRFCSTCGRPVANDGRTGKRGKGHREPCPECGFRRKRHMSEKQKAAQKENMERFSVVAKEYREGGMSLERRTRKAAPRVSDLLRERAEEEADIIIRPYIEGLRLEPKEEWSPGTKLEFFMNQTQIAEKMLNRVEGMPVARTRHVDSQDEDVLKTDELSSGTLIQLVAALASGSEANDVVEGEIVDVEVIPADSGSNNAESVD